jgi:hypothetical protein
VAGWSEQSLDPVHQIVRPYLGAGEVIVATIPVTYTVSRYRWWLFLVSYLFVIFTRHYWALVLTDQRLFVCDSGRIAMRPKVVTASYPRSGVRLVSVKHRWFEDHIDIDMAGVQTRFRALAPRKLLRAWNEKFVAALAPA